MSGQAIPFQKPSLIDRLFNRAFGFLVSLGLGFKHTYLLEVQGRKSGKLYSISAPSSVIHTAYFNGSVPLFPPKRGRASSTVTQSTRSEK